MDNKKIKILLIDDEEEFSSTLAERLELRGYDARTASSGGEGLTLAESEAFDITVLDLMMPEMNGLDALEHLKRAHPAMPIILLTGHGSTKEGMEGMRRGAFDYLIKPLDINELIKKILTAVDA